MSKRCRGAIGWPLSQGVFFTLLLIAPLIYLSGCGSGQTDVGQANGNSVPVSLNISMPQESAAASTVGSRFWATLRSWLPTPTNAWAITYSNLTAIKVVVAGPGLPSPITTNFIIPQESLPPESGDAFPIIIDVPVGLDRVFTVSGFNLLSDELILRGESTPTTLTAGQTAVVEVILTNVTGTGTVTGTLTNAGTGAVLPGATVAVTGTSLSTTTNSDGNFTLDGVPQGRQTLAISAPGFTSRTQTVTVVAGTSVSAGTVPLTPLPITGTVTGTVTNTGTGTTLPGATVAVTGTSLSTTTNSDGNFTLNGVPQGRQTLAISAPGFTSRTQAVTVTAGTSVSAGTIALTPLPTTGTVTGTVTNAETGAPLFRATVTVNGTRLSTTTLDNGTFTLNGISQGRQTLTVSASGFTSTSRDVTITAGASISAGTIALTPVLTTGTVTGTVTHAGTGLGFPQATVTAVVDDRTLSTTSNRDGNFTLNDVSSGPLTLTIRAGGYASKTKSVTVVAGSSVSAGTITLNPAELARILITRYNANEGLCFPRENFETFTLSPSFNPEQSTYTVDVPSNTSFCIVMTRASSMQTVTLNGVNVPHVDPGPEEELYPIIPGFTGAILLFRIVVTAPDEETRKTYMLTVLPFQLSSTQCEDTLSPTLSYGDSSYSVKRAKYNQHLDDYGHRPDGRLRFIIDGAATISGAPSSRWRCG